MKFIVSLVLMALLSFTACLYLPWWSISVACFIVAVLVVQKPWLAFLSGFLGLLLLWGGLSIWISHNNHHILALKMSQIIAKKESPALLILLTALIGAIVGGLGALTGSFLRFGKKTVG
jgi:hypothetical protein